ELLPARSAVRGRGVVALPGADVRRGEARHPRDGHGRVGGQPARRGDLAGGVVPPAAALPASPGRPGVEGTAAVTFRRANPPTRRGVLPGFPQGCPPPCTGLGPRHLSCYAKDRCVRDEAGGRRWNCPFESLFWAWAWSLPPHFWLPRRSACSSRQSSLLWHHRANKS